MKYFVIMCDEGTGRKPYPHAVTTDRLKAQDFVNRNKHTPYLENCQIWEVQAVENL